MRLLKDTLRATYAHRQKLSALGIAGFMALAWSASASAGDTPLPDATFYLARYTGTGPTNSATVPGILTGPDGQASDSIYPAPYAYTRSNSPDGAGYSSLVNYYFAIDPSADVQTSVVPISIAFNLATSATGSYARGQSWIYSPLFGQVNACSDTNGGGFCGANNTANVIDSWTGTVNVGYSNLIQLFSDSYSDEGSTAIGYADPMITVLDSNFHLTLSQGFGNLTAPAPASGVPEPSTWAMMLIGFGLVGAAMRSTRRQRLNTSYA